MISTTSSALLFLALTAASSLAAPIRIPIGARDVAAAPAVEQLVRRIPQAIAPVTVEPRSEEKDKVVRRFPRRIYYEHYARNVAAGSNVASEDITRRAPVPETPVVEVEARDPEVDAPALASRNQRRELRKRSLSGEKAARALVSAPGVKPRSLGSRHPAFEARERTKYRRAVPAEPLAARAPVAAPVVEKHAIEPRVAEPVAAKPIARDVQPEAQPVARDVPNVVVREVTPPAVVARDNAIRALTLEESAKVRRAEAASRPSLFARVAKVARDIYFGDVHVHSTTETVHNGDKINGDSTTIVQVTPIDGSTTIYDESTNYDMPTTYDVSGSSTDDASSDPSSGKSSTGAKGSEGAKSSESSTDSTPGGSGSGSFIPGGTASGTPTMSGATATVTDASAVTGTPTLGGPATVTVTVTTTETVAVATPTGTASGSVASSSTPSGTAVISGGSSVVSATASASADPATATTTATGMSTGGMKSGTKNKNLGGATPTPLVARRDSSHAWMKLMRRETPVARRAERRSGVWSRDLSS